MSRHSDVPLSSALRDQAGFGLIEAIVAAALLAFLALGVLAGLDGAASSSGREKARSVASALAEKDQERLHAKRAVDLPNLRETQTPAPVIGGTTYNVVSEGDWVSDSTGGTLSCTSSAGAASYLRLRTTVTSNTVGTRTDPVVIESLVAPPIGSAGGNNGTLAVQINNRDNVGVPGRSVSVVGANTAHAQTETTNGLGCAIFALIPADSYDIQVNTAGWVDPAGTEDVHVAGQVNTGATSLVSVVYDRAGSVNTGFDTRWWDPRAAAARTSASTAWWLAAENSGVPAGGIRRFQDTVAPIEPLTTINATKMFPFKDGYGLHTGQCTEENPKLYDAPWSLTNAFQQIEPTLTYNRTLAPAKPIRQPALNARVAYGKLAAPNATVNSWQGDANVIAKLAPSNPGSVCKDAEIIPGLVSDATWGLQTYPTNRAPIAAHPRSGTSPLFATGLAGFVTKRPTAAVEYDPGLPFGRWQVCASKNIGGVGNRRAFVVIDNGHTDFVPPPPTVIDLRASTNPLSQAGTCPTTATDAAWPVVP